MRFLFFKKNKILVHIVSGAVLCFLTFCFALCLSSSVFASGADPQPGDKGTLTVIYNDEVVRVFTTADLEAIADAEGNQQYSFSAYNTYPTFMIYPRTVNEKTPYVGGPTVSGILAEAGLSGRMRANDLLTFSDWSGYSGRMTYSQLTEPRFYYPNGDKNTKNGAFDNDASAEDKVQVPAVIDLINKDISGKLFIGQKYSNDQVTPVYVDDIADGGCIKIENNAGRWGEAMLKDRVVRGMIPVSSKLHFDTSAISVPGKADAKIYYTTDGSEPDRTSVMYNFTADRFMPPAGDAYRNFPDTSQAGHLTLKTKIIGLGKNDGPVTTFELDLVSQETYEQAMAEEDDPTQKIDISGSKVTLSNSSFQYSNNEKKPVVTIENDNKLLTEKVDYNISYINNKNIGTAFVSIIGTGKYTGTIKKSFRIVPAKAVIYKTLPYKNAVTVKYRKKAGGVKYKIAIKLAGKSWKTYNNGSRLSKKFTKLRSKKNYYIKVRAFKTVKGKTYLGPWSATNKVRTR